MKKKMGIFLLVLGTLLIVGGIIYSIVMRNQDQSKSKKEDEKITVDGSYTCNLKEKQFETEDGSMVTATESYDFSYSNKEIRYASITTSYKFLDLNSYHNFVWSDKNSSSAPNRTLENEEKLEKQYQWLITIQKENGYYDIKDYINQLGNMGYTCKER